MRIDVWTHLLSPVYRRQIEGAGQGSPHGVKCVVDFFGSEHVLFGTDTPFDTRGGAAFIPAATSDVASAVPDAGARAGIFEDNARRLLGVHTPA
ncbi:MAG: amidohydrolase [bacterium]|jgi:aminocarboxymuconate-semialdehyde decarboxylase|nr:amidohydrolase [bacterium]